MAELPEEARDAFAPFPSHQCDLDASYLLTIGEEGELMTIESYAFLRHNPREQFDLVFADLTTKG